MATPSTVLTSRNVSRRAGAITELAPVYGLVTEDFASVNALILEQLNSEVTRVEEVGRYIVDSGGKRLRPLLVLLGAGACGYRGRDQIRLAAIIEFLHTATLLHDDVVDHSKLRRGRATANAVWGNASSVLVGDFLYSRAFQLMVETGSMTILAVLSEATNLIAEGEVRQLANIGNLDIDEAAYRDIIRAKTALLFQAASHTAAELAGADRRTAHALRDYGLHFGMAYQLVDDWLDYAGDAEQMGKNVGDDLAEGKLTLPLIRALTEAKESDAELIRSAVRDRSAARLDEIVSVVHATGALEATRLAAREEGDAAIAQLDALPASGYRDALETLARYSVSRLA